jgi:hypothetical protein
MSVTTTTSNLWTSIKKVFKDVLTGKNNQTFDIAKISWFLGVLFFLGFSAYNILKEGKMDYMVWTGAFSTLMAASSAAVKIKESTEPNP